MRILVDADACPVRRAVVAAARSRGLPVLMVCDYNHAVEDGYSEVLRCDPGADSADYALANRAAAGDVVVTQDYGLAALALGKGAHAIHPSGLVFTHANIELLLAERHASARVRRSGGRTRGPKKRTGEDDERFREAFGRLLDGCPR